MSYNTKMYDKNIIIDKIILNKDDDKLFFFYKDKKISPWHNIPYKKKKQFILYD